MTPTYQKTSWTSDSGKVNEVIIRIEDTTSFAIPNDAANRHYREYLEWLAEGNTAEVIEG